MSAQAGRILIEKSEGVAYLTIDNPGRRNALTAGMMRSFADNLPGLDADGDVHVIVVRGDRDFAAGGDLSDAESPEDMARLALRTFATFEALKKPLIASIRGYCIGGAIAIAMKADIRIAGRSVQFSLPEARIGTNYPLNEIEDLVREIGPSAVKMLFFSADRIKAEEAFSMGLVNRLVDDEALDEEVTAIANRIATHAPLSLDLFKKSVRYTTHGGDKAAIERLFTECGNSEDAVEGLRAFAEKRTPRFMGR